MSLTSPIPNEQGIAFTAVGQPCFYCCETIEQDPAVHWFGAMGSIYLHPRCVFDWSVSLFRDLHELRKPERYQP